MFPLKPINSPWTNYAKRRACPAVVILSAAKDLIAVNAIRSFAALRMTDIFEQLASREMPRK
jgi:hypothetical protein